VQSGEVVCRILDGGDVIEVERINAMFAELKRAIRAAVTRVAIASHSRVFVPKVVDVLVGTMGQFLNGFADAVA